MKNPKRGKRPQDLKLHPFPQEMGVTDEKYAAYVKEHEKKLRRLEREQAGWNMLEPE
jgi:hypothetical protein